MKKINRDDFPYQVSNIYDPPENLYVLGKLPSPNLIPIGMVGSRNYTQYGKLVSINLIEGLKDFKVAILTSLDSPLNSVIIKSAIKNNIPVICFVPSGLKNIYPKTNSSLVDTIVKNGAVVSEYPENEKADEKKILARNRLLGGIPKLTVVMECERKSQERIIGKFALEYNRELGAVPHEIFSLQGTNDLIKEGAHPITEVEDIIEILELEKRKQKTPENLTENEKEILKLLPMEKDEIKETLKLSDQEIQATIVLLEMKNLIEERLGVIRAI